ncbi:MAG: dihydropteroate synthase [Pseudomonadota bacterium]|jgi:dihydropteroate synthase
MQLRCRTRWLALDQPVVMGVLNVTPDSFSDGGLYAAPAAALTQARRLLAAGAAIIDVGGESTRPGAVRPSVAEEMDRVLPVIERIAAELDVVISVDTSRPEVVQASCAAGAHLINDIRGLRAPATLAAAAAAGAAVCVMHMQGEPQTMQQAPYYADVVEEVEAYLRARIAECRAAGIAADAILIDPGFGFGKTQDHNLALFRHLGRFTRLGVPLLVGVSRKSMVGQLTGRPVGERLAGSVSLAALAAARGAAVLRAHDVAETVDAVRVGAALRSPLEEG